MARGFNLLAMKPRTNRALIVLFCLALVVQVMEIYYFKLFPNQMFYTEEQIAHQRASWEKEAQIRDSIYRSRLHLFNPNVEDSTYWVSIGVSPRLAHNWRSYLKSGGYFGSSSDLLRLYGMDSATWLRISDFMQFPKEYSESSKTYTEETVSLHARRFNPNEISESELKEMGLPTKALNGIISYREKYKPFESEDDLYDVYGLDSNLAAQLVDWVDLPENKILKDVLIPMDINRADTTALIAIKGLGRYRAQRIVEWRIRLGGFHNLDQLQEFHIADSILIEGISPYLFCGPLERQLYLNESSLEDLQAHPYISYYLARDIVNFRERLRAFKKVDELMNIELVDDVLFSKLAPYLEVSASDSI